MEYNEKSKKLKKKIALILVFVLLITSFIFFVYYDHINSVWNDYEAIDSFSGNCEHFDKIAEIVLKHSKKNNYTYYIADSYEIYAWDDNNRDEIQLSKNDLYSLNKIQETLGCYSFVIIIREYGVAFSRDENLCRIVYIYKDVDIDDINSDFIKEPSKFLRFKKIEKNWYNTLPEDEF